MTGTADRTPPPSLGGFTVYPVLHERSRAEEFAKIGAEMMMGAARMGGLRMPKPAEATKRALLDRCRDMVRQGESPWHTFRHLIRAGKVRLIKRPNKPPLLVAVKQRRGLR